MTPPPRRMMFRRGMSWSRFASLLYRNLMVLRTTSSAYCGGLQIKITTLYDARSKLLDRTFNL